MLGGCRRDDTWLIFCNVQTGTVDSDIGTVVGRQCVNAMGLQQLAMDAGLTFLFQDDWLVGAGAKQRLLHNRAGDQHQQRKQKKFPP